MNIIFVSYTVIIFVSFYFVAVEFLRCLEFPSSSDEGDFV